MVDQLLSSPLDDIPIHIGQGDPHLVYRISPSAFEAFRTITDQLQQEKVQLNRENLELAGRLGFYQSEIQHLQARLRAAEEEIRLLKAPTEVSSGESSERNSGSITEQNGQDSGTQAVSEIPEESETGRRSEASAPVCGPFKRFWRRLTQLL